MNAINKLILISLILFNISCSENKVEKIHIQYQTVTTTSDPVSCENYEMQFSETDNEIDVDKQGIPTKILSQFSESKDSSINVRGRLKITFANRQEIYCFDQFGLFYKNGKFYSNPELWTFISKKYIDNLDRLVE